MLREAIAYPIRGEGAGKRLFVGGVLVLLSILVVPAFFLYGYFLRVLESTARGGTEPPTFDGWRELFVDGFKAFVVVLAYLLPVYVLAVVLPAVYTFVVPMGSSGQEPSSAAVGLFVFVLVVVTPLTLLAYYLMPAGLTGLALSGEVSAAFDVESVGTIARSRAYFVGMLLAAAVAVVGGFVATLLWIVVVGFFLQFYVYLSVAYVAGRSVGKAAG